MDVKLLLLEVKATTPSNQMDLDQAIKVINPRDKNVSPEERHKWRMPELPPVPKFFATPNELLSSSEEVHGPRKDKRTSEGLDTHVFQGTSSTDKSLFEIPKHFVRGPEEEVGPRKGQQPSGSCPSLHKQKSSSTSAKKGQESPKEQSEGQLKGKGKIKIQLEQALPTELQNSQKGEDSHGQCAQYGKSSDGIQKQGGGKIEPIFSKYLDLVKLVIHFETSNKEILAKINNFEYIQQNLGREILKVKESQKTIIGLENVNQDNILSLTQICARIESKVILFNQPDDNSFSFIARKLKEFGIQVQSLENSTGHNAALLQEQLRKGDKASLELKEDIQSSSNNISLKNEFPRHSTPILDRNVLNLNND
ncbi:hypothetical protein O181_056523 [Austropuccinia psidii MF-1]|uniref:Uncharacterized protein n=1 Tax=Austropuccinia psidii MF-1 TaxID=1389203 RepID=A0A9Q3ED91_9BASI|nr:hypothetical protein [Austropuccinia psidii MF-1]